MCAEMYNACLESWRGTYSWWKEHHDPLTEKFPSELNQSKYDLMRQFTGVREEIAEWNRLSVKVGRGVICRFDRPSRLLPQVQRRREARVSTVQAAAPVAFRRDTRSNTVYGLRARHRPEPIGTLVETAGQGSPSTAVLRHDHRLSTALGPGAEVVELPVVRTPLRTEVHVW